VIENAFQKAIDDGWKKAAGQWPIFCLICGGVHTIGDTGRVHIGRKCRLESIDRYRQGDTGDMVLVEETMSDEEIRRKIKELYD
jgi:hypothetical protein